MKRTVFISLLFVLSALLLVSCGPLKINISYPDVETTIAPGAEVILLRSVSDNRNFLDRTRPLNVPSWSGSPGKADEKKKIIGRTPHDNIYLTNDRMIDSVIGEIIKNSLFREGYTVMYNTKAFEGATQMDVFINNFWVYRAGKNLIQAEMDILFTIDVNGTVQTRTVTVTGTNTTEHFENIQNWEMAVNAMLDEFIKILRTEFTNIRSAPPPPSDRFDNEQKDLLRL